MPAPVYSVQLISVSPALPDNTVVVPDGSRLVLRDIDVYCASLVDGDAMNVLNAASGLLWFVQYKTAVGVRFFQWRGRQVYYPGESIVFHVYGGDWDIQASGYELTLP